MVAFTHTNNTSPPHPGISVFIIDGDENLDQIRMGGYLGPGTLDLPQLFFDDACIPADTLISEKDEGFYYTIETMDESDSRSPLRLAQHRVLWTLRKVISRIVRRSARESRTTKQYDTGSRTSKRASRRREA